MSELSLYLYAYPDENCDISDEITCVILDEYIRINKLDFYSIDSDKEFLAKAKRLSKSLKEYIASTDIAAGLELKPITEVELVVEKVDGPTVKEWVVWKKNKKEEK